jgi:hypothetical protein
MANGFYVLYSRDPHLAAIGFVWNPLQSMADMVPLLFNHLWPALASRDMAGTIVSSLSMAGATYQLLAGFREWGVRRAPRLVLALLFALNPMVIYYGANGMSEALYLFTLVSVCRYLARWLRTDDLRSLVYAAAALGFCYLARDEAVTTAAAAGALVFAASLHRGTGVRHARVMRGLTDAVVFLLPFATCLVGWAVASYVITGSLFEQFTSVYGTASQIRAGATGITHLGAGIRLEAEALLYLAPLLVLIILVAVVLAVHRRDLLILAPVTVIAASLAFDLVAYLMGKIIWSFRYFIAAVPLEVALVGVMLATVSSRSSDGAIRSPQALRAGSAMNRISTLVRRSLPAVVGSVVALVLLVPSLPAAAAGMFNPRIGVEEVKVLGYVVHARWTSVDRYDSLTFPRSQDIASYIGHLRLPNGDVVVDNSSPCIPFTIVFSPDPKVFVIPNDRDFQRVLADPLTFHAHYILVPPPNGVGSLAATNRSYPSLYANGQGFATLAHTFSAGGICPSFRLYRVTGHPNANV